LEVTSSQNLTR